MDLSADEQGSHHGPHALTIRSSAFHHRELRVRMLSQHSGDEGQCHVHADIDAVVTTPRQPRVCEPTEVLHPGISETVPFIDHDRFRVLDAARNSSPHRESCCSESTAAASIFRTIL